MTEASTCGHCGEEIDGEPIRRGDKLFCCEACAFEAGRSVDCGGRSDSHIVKPIVEQT